MSPKFQYISCYGLSFQSLTVYPALQEFQYISCYGLSAQPDNQNQTYSKFQYISCYGLSMHLHESNKEEINFNTSHVTVYPILRNLPASHAGFQYISCYGLSKIWTKQQTFWVNFNTSHVTVYPRPDYFVLGENIISIHLMLRFITPISHIYINIILISIHLMLRFILFHLLKLERGSLISIHLMLRFIRKCSRLILRKCNFNTSHVTVYLHIISSFVFVYCISIHLMLRFIFFNHFLWFQINSFQYISCYGLSLWRNLWNDGWIISIHLMLRFI